MMRKLLKPLVFLLALVPAGYLGYRTYSNDLGVNPAETLQLETGEWALKFLIITLAVTPVRRLTVGTASSSSGACWDCLRSSTPVSTFSPTSFSTNISPSAR
jgi:hypothetical protein